MKTEKPFYIAGDCVQGHAFLYLQEPFPGSQIYLKLKGYEEIWWRERHTRQIDRNGTRETETYYTYHSGKKVFYSHRFVLYTSTQSYLNAG